MTGVNECSGYVVVKYAILFSMFFLTLSKDGRQTPVIVIQIFILEYSLTASLKP